MEAKELIARRVALELRDGTLVNLGIGLPTLVAVLPRPTFPWPFSSQNGIIGFGAPPSEGMEDPEPQRCCWRVHFCRAGRGDLRQRSQFHSDSRGGHLDMTVLGGLQVDSRGRLANWMVPGKLVPGMGGAMDLVSGAKRVIVAMQHTAKRQAQDRRRADSAANVEASLSRSLSPNWPLSNRRLRDCCSGSAPQV